MGWECVSPSCQTPLWLSPEYSSCWPFRMGWQWKSGVVTMGRKEPPSHIAGLCPSSLRTRKLGPGSQLSWSQLGIGLHQLSLPSASTFLSQRWKCKPNTWDLRLPTTGKPHARQEPSECCDCPGVMPVLWYISQQCTPSCQRWPGVPL